MADILHGSARTTPRVRAELQSSKEATGSLARRYGLSRTAVAKWWSRTTTADAPMGARDPKSTVLTPVEEAMIVEFRRRRRHQALRHRGRQTVPRRYCSASVLVIVPLMALPLTLLLP
jgi:hypothetical protein